VREFVLDANGWHDFTTPFCATGYPFARVSGDLALPDRIRLTCHPAGPMMYIDEPLRQNAPTFERSANGP
jgi:carboxypeptidase C (cathepsin A)